MERHRCILLLLFGQSFSILSGSLANGTLTRHAETLSTRHTFSILSGSLANGTQTSSHQPQPESHFQYPQRIVSQWNPWPSYGQGFFLRAFSILSGSLANGTECKRLASVLIGIFQYPQRIVSQWNPHRRCGRSWSCRFQYPQRIVSQWNAHVSRRDRSRGGDLSVSSADR